MPDYIGDFLHNYNLAPLKEGMFTAGMQSPVSRDDAAGIDYDKIVNDAEQIFNDIAKGGKKYPAVKASDLSKKYDTGAYIMKAELLKIDGKFRNTLKQMLEESLNSGYAYDNLAGSKGLLNGDDYYSQEGNLIFVFEDSPKLEAWLGYNKYDTGAMWMNDWFGELENPFKLVSVIVRAGKDVFYEVPAPLNFAASEGKWRPVSLDAGGPTPAETIKEYLDFLYTNLRNPDMSNLQEMRLYINVIMINEGENPNAAPAEINKVQKLWSLWDARPKMYAPPEPEQKRSRKNSQSLPVEIDELKLEGDIDITIAKIIKFVRVNKRMLKGRGPEKALYEAGRRIITDQLKTATPQQIGVLKPVYARYAKNIPTIRQTIEEAIAVVEETGEMPISSNPEHDDLYRRLYRIKTGQDTRATDEDIIRVNIMFAVFGTKSYTPEETIADTEAFKAEHGTRPMKDGEIEGEKALYARIEAILNGSNQAATKEHAKKLKTILKNDGRKEILTPAQTIAEFKQFVKKHQRKMFTMKKLERVPGEYLLHERVYKIRVGRNQKATEAQRQELNDMYAMPFEMLLEILSATPNATIKWQAANLYELLNENNMFRVVFLDPADKNFGTDINEIVNEGFYPEKVAQEYNVYDENYNIIKREKVVFYSSSLNMAQGTYGNFLFVSDNSKGLFIRSGKGTDYIATEPVKPSRVFYRHNNNWIEIPFTAINQSEWKPVSQPAANFDNITFASLVRRGRGIVWGLHDKDYKLLYYVKFTSNFEHEALVKIKELLQDPQFKTEGEHTVAHLQSLIGDDAEALPEHIKKELRKELGTLSLESSRKLVITNAENSEGIDTYTYIANKKDNSLKSYSDEALNKYLRGQPITAEEWAEFVSMIERLHAKGILHGDLHQNVHFWRTEDGKLHYTLIDFYQYKSGADTDIYSLKIMEKSYTAAGVIKSANLQPLSRDLTPKGTPNLGSIPFSWPLEPVQLTPPPFHLD